MKRPINQMHELTFPKHPDVPGKAAKLAMEFVNFGLSTNDMSKRHNIVSNCINYLHPKFVDPKNMGQVAKDKPVTEESFTRNKFYLISYHYSIIILTQCS